MSIISENQGNTSPSPDWRKAKNIHLKEMMTKLADSKCEPGELYLSEGWIGFEVFGTESRTEGIRLWKVKDDLSGEFSKEILFAEREG